MPYRPTARTEARRLAVRERILLAARDQVAEQDNAAIPEVEAFRAAGGKQLISRHRVQGAVQRNGVRSR